MIEKDANDRSDYDRKNNYLDDNKIYLFMIYTMNVTMQKTKPSSIINISLICETKNTDVDRGDSCLI